MDVDDMLQCKVSLSTNMMSLMAQAVQSSESTRQCWRKPQHLHLKVLPCKLCAKVRRTVLDSWPDLLNSGNISSPSKPSQQGQPSGEQSPLERRAVVAVDLMSLSTAISLGVQTSRNKWKHKALQTIIKKSKTSVGQPYSKTAWATPLRVSYGFMR